MGKEFLLASFPIFSESSSETVDFPLSFAARKKFQLCGKQLETIFTGED